MNYIRWMIRRDLPEVLEIDRQGFRRPWDEEDFYKVLRVRNCIGMVAERDERIVGFMVYELHRTRLEVLRLAVAEDCRRQGVGRGMLDKLRGKLSQQHRTMVGIEVSERNLGAQLWLRACGVEAVRIEERTIRFVMRLRARMTTTRRT